MLGRRDSALVERRPRALRPVVAGPCVFRAWCRLGAKRPGIAASARHRVAGDTSYRGVFCHIAPGHATIIGRGRAGGCINGLGHSGSWVAPVARNRCPADGVRTGWPATGATRDPTGEGVCHGKLMRPGARAGRVRGWQREWRDCVCGAGPARGRGKKGRAGSHHARICML